MTAREVVENYWRIECTRDLEAILRCYAPDAEMVVPGLGRLVGHEEISRFYQASIDRFPELEVDVVSGIEAGDGGAFEWRAAFRDRSGKGFGSKGVNIVRVADGCLQSVHVYFDPTELEEEHGVGEMP